MSTPPGGAGQAPVTGRRTRRGQVAVAALLVVGSVACGRPPEPVTVPVFPAAAVPVAAVGEGDGASERLTCADLVPAEEVQTVLGLPVGGVVVRSVDGVPAPSVGRLARVSCRYAVDDPAWPVRGEVLVVVAATFVDDAAARAQSARNVADLAGSSSPVPMGAAEAVLVDGPGRHDLLVAYGRGTVDLTVTAGAGLPGPPASVLTDLARRVLARAEHRTATTAGGPVGDGTPTTGPRPDAAPRPAARLRGAPPRSPTR